ncbi:MAG: YHYH protein [Arenimonas sp.]
MPRYAVSFAQVLITASVSISCLCLAHGGSKDVDLTRLPLGDGHISEHPLRGSIWPCQTGMFGTRRSHGGEWIKTDGSFDFSNKPVTEGDIYWPSKIEINLVNKQRRITGNDLPKHATGTFPIPAGSIAYRYDANPNSISAQNVLIYLPANPVLAQSSSCVPGGAIGMLLSGGLLFNALDANGEDAVAHEIQDKCQGHPQRSGAYHYHNLTTCQPDQGTGHSLLIGYAFDGFGIFGRRGEDGKILSNADLDECHGHTHAILWDGKRVSMYHYHATWEYPYTLGCFKGSPQRLPLQQGGRMRPG